MQEHKTTKLVQASTIACSSSAMLEQQGSTGSTKSNVSSRVESSRDEPSGIWAYTYKTQKATQQQMQMCAVATSIGLISRSCRSRKGEK